MTSFTTKIPESEIRETIWNIMLEKALKRDRNTLINSLKNVDTRPTAIRSLVMETVTELSESGQGNSFMTMRNNKVTMENVPNSFKELFISLSVLKNYNSGYERGIVLNKIILESEKRDTFKSIIGDFIKFYLESQTEKKEVVTIESIRETFYNMMVEKVLIGGAIDKKTLQDMEGYIFYDLSAFVILDSVLENPHTDGIKLFNKSVVTAQNCPAEYTKFYVMLNVAKTKIKEMKLTNKQIELVKLLSSSDPDVVIPDELLVLKTSVIMQLVSVIKDMAIQISQVQSFKNIIDNVIAFCIDAL